MKKYLLFAVLAAGTFVQPLNAQFVNGTQKLKDEVNSTLEDLGLSADIERCGTGHKDSTAIACVRNSTTVPIESLKSDEFKGWTVVRLNSKSKPNRICVYSKHKHPGISPYNLGGTLLAGYAVVDGSWREIGAERCKTGVIEDR